MFIGRCNQASLYRKLLHECLIRLYHYYTCYWLCGRATDKMSLAWSHCARTCTYSALGTAKCMQSDEEPEIHVEQLLYIQYWFTNHYVSQYIFKINHYLSVVSLSFLQPSKADFHAAFDVVFVDPSGYLNLCAGMTVAQYRRVSELCCIRKVLGLVFFSSR